MASFAPNKIDLSQIHNGQRYQNGDIVSPEAINAPIEASAWAQETADKANKMSEEAVSKAEQALNYGIGNTQGTFPVLAAYPIGTFFITRSSTNPAELFGGFWLRIKDAFLWASGDIKLHQYNKDGVFTEESLSVGSRGGEFAHSLTEEELASHSHRVEAFTLNYPYAVTGGGAQNGTTIGDATGGLAQLHVPAHETTATGYGYPHNNMPPYYAVNAWVRVTEEEFNANESL